MNKQFNLRLFSIATIVVFSLFLLTGFAAAGTYYANDENSLTASFSSAIDGDIIIINNNISLTSTTIPFSNSGVITIKSSDSMPKTIYGNGTTTPNFNTHMHHFVLDEINNSNTCFVFENVILDGNGGTGGIKIMGKSQAPYDSADNITIKNVQIRNSTTAGFLISDADNVTLNNITVEKCADSGILITRCSDFVISDSVIRDNTALSRGGGIQINADDVGTSSVEIYGNTLIENNTASQGAGIYIGGSLNANPANKAELDIYGDVIITKNKATNGGGLSVSSNATTNVYGNTTLSENEGSMAGGILLSDDSVLKIYENAQVVKNKATGSSQAVGGAVFMQNGATLDVYGNAVISENTANPSASSASYGGAVYAASSAKEINVYGNAVINENQAKSGGALFSGANLSIFDTAQISKNNATTGGAVYSGGNISVFGNSSIHSNTADYGGGLYLTTAGKETKFYDSASVNNNTANYDGGGIYTSSTRGNLDLKNNVTFSKNTAVDGYGGALCVYSPSSLITISGTNPDDYVEFSSNTATWDGGAVWISGVSQLSNTAGQKLLFSSNSAETGYKWDETNGSLTGDMAIAAPVYLSQMPNVTPSVPFTNAYNNFDISFTEGQDDIEPAVIGIYYFKDSLQTSDLGYEEFNYYVGGSLTTTAISDALGTEWLNLYKPAGYNDGKLQQTLPFTVSSDSLLEVLYSKGGGNNSTGGGNGTGNATVKDPSNESGNGGGFAGSNETGMEGFEEEEPLLPGGEIKESACWLWIILLLIIIAIAVYLYRRYRERKEEQL